MRALACLLALAAATPALAAERPVDGRWWGRYQYADPARPIVTFTVDVKLGEGGKLTGTIVEDPSDFAPAGTGKLTASLHGTYRDGELRFLKVYAFDASKQVEYRGVHVGDEISGTWTIPGTSYGGTFFWKRSPPKKPATMPPPL